MFSPGSVCTERRVRRTAFTTEPIRMSPCCNAICSCLFHHCMKCGAANCTDLCHPFVLGVFFFLKRPNFQQPGTHIFSNRAIDLWRVASSVFYISVHLTKVCTIFGFKKKAQTFTFSKTQITFIHSFCTILFFFFPFFSLQPLTLLLRSFKMCIFLNRHNLSFRIEGSNFQIWNINRCREYFLFYKSLCVLKRRKNKK